MLRDLYFINLTLPKYAQYILLDYLPVIYDTFGALSTKRPTKISLNVNNNTLENKWLCGISLAGCKQYKYAADTKKHG